MSMVFTNGPGDLSSIPGRVKPKTQKMVLDTVLINTQHYKLRLKGKVDQSREWSSTLSCISVLYLLKREPSGHPRLKVANFTYMQFNVNNLYTVKWFQAWLLGMSNSISIPI